MDSSDRATHSMTLAEAFRARRSVRAYDARTLESGRLLQLFQAGQGITAGDGKRAVPSAHALYPLMLFLAAGRVEGLGVGLHQYDPADNVLSQISSGDLRPGLVAAALEDQPWIAEAPATIVIAADTARAVAAFAEQPPDGRRGLRYVYLEAGALMQNVCLQAAALGLGTVFVGGFDDAKTASVLNLPISFEPVGMICVGWPAA